MTCIAACVGLLPAALSTAIGAQVQRPLALVVVGGILLTPILVPSTCRSPGPTIIPYHMMGSVVHYSKFGLRCSSRIIADI
jgi:hypothetical protein